MCSRALGTDCLKAILCKPPLAELLKNVNLQLVSKQFSDALRLALKAKAGQTPVALEISLKDSLSVLLGNVPVPSTKLADFQTSYLLDFVSELHFDEGWSKLQDELTATVHEIIQRLRATDKLILKLVKNKRRYCGSEFYRREDRNRLQFYALRKLVSGGHHFLSTLTALEVYSSVVSPQFYLDICGDFTQLLALTVNLNELAVPTALFRAVLKTRNPREQLLSRLSKLELEETCLNDKAYELPCQSVVSAVCDACLNLTHLRYACREDPPRNYYDGKHSCIDDFAVFQKLSKLRCLALNLEAEQNYRRESGEILVQPILTLKALAVTGRPFYTDSQILALVDMAPNATRLHFSDTVGAVYAEEPTIGRTLYEKLRDGLTSRRLPNLRSLSFDAYSRNYDSFRSLDVLTAIPAPVALRSIRFHQELYRSYDDYPDRKRSVELLKAISQATCVAHLRTRFCWEESYLILERLLKAMQCGSIVLLTLDVIFGIETDQRLFNAILPSGCEISEWNVFDRNEFPDSIVIRGTKITANTSDIHVCNENITQRFFTVRLQNRIF